MEAPELPVMTDTKLKRIAYLSSRDKDAEFDCLMHHFNQGSLFECFLRLDGKKAVGADGITKEQYGERLNENLADLLDRMKRMAYRPQPVLKVLIPKEGQPNSFRPLGISVFEDKLVQMAMQQILESIYEPLFLDCSYGFRPGRSCHDAIRALHQHLFKQEVQSIIDVDLENYFGSINHELLSVMLSAKIKDRRLLRYIRRLFKAGVLWDGELSTSDEGVPQGSICSPILSNIFAHYVIDEWFEEIVKPHCRGNVVLFRYCDDAVICCQYDSDRPRVLKALSQRLAKYQLKLNEEKTRSVSFSKPVTRRDKRDTFDFLGFTFYWGKSRKGRPLPKLKSSGKRLRSKLRKVREWVVKHRHRYDLLSLWIRFRAKLRGHIQYYGVSFNLMHVRTFLLQATRILFKWLNRRSQRKSFSWQKFSQFVAVFPLPQAKVCHALF
jgi:group II intron reverse transcriptase/maturase